MTIDETGRAVARLYAEAILGLAEERSATDEIRDQLAALSGLVAESSDFAAFLASPLIAAGERREVLETALRGRASDLLVDALQVLNNKGRLGLLPAVAATYQEALRERRGEIAVKVASAVPLDEALRGKLASAISRFTGRTPQLEERVDPELIAGMVLEIGDRKIDSSLARELARLRQILADRASREVQSGHGAVVET